MPKQTKQILSTIKEQAQGAKCHFCSSEIDSFDPEDLMHCKVRLHESTMQVACPNCSSLCDKKECG